MMINGTLALFLGLLLGGCAQGAVGTLPAVPDPERAATVVVVRPYHLVGSAVTYSITIDGAEVCELGTDEHVVIRVPAGERFVGLKTWDPAIPLSRIHPTQTIQAEAHRTYYFRVGHGRIDRATEADGRELVSRTKALVRGSPNTVR
jgi:hypothetical protein